MKYPLAKYPRLGQYPHEATKKELVGYVEDLTDYLQDCLAELREIQNKEVPQMRHLVVVYVKELLGE